MVRLYRSTDITTLKAIHTLLWGPETPFECPDLGNVYWMAKMQGSPVGYCSVRPLRKWSGEPRWGESVFLSRAGLLKLARGKGTQRRMIRKRLQWARSEGFKRACTYTSYDNVPSMRSLIREGFMPYKPEYWWAGDVVYFEREL
jgi:GNAT superfamily N-acetyltransferase